MMRHAHFGVVAVTLALLACAGCASGEAAPQSSQLSLCDTTWVLQEYGAPDDLCSSLPSTAITLTFHGSTHCNGVAGCNWFSAIYTSHPDGRIEFASLEHTLKHCDDTGMMQQEQAFLDALAAANRYEYVGDALHISGDGVLLVFSQA